MSESDASTTNIASGNALVGVQARNLNNTAVNVIGTVNNYHGTQPPTSPEDAAANLAVTVRLQWDQEARRQAVHGDRALPVRFGPAASTPGAPELSGRLAEIAAVYESIPSGRLVVLGEAGSGKTILALRFVLSRLENPGAGDRVPVIFSLGSWNPKEIALRDWMCRRMLLDYPALEGLAASGGNLADALIDGDHILPVLDGFDEIASGLRAKALEALDFYAKPLVLTSRPKEYAAAVKENSALADAACVQLEALGIEDIDAYLTSAGTRDSGVRAAWEPVLEQLRAEPPTPGAAIVAEALATPLMLALARTIYRGSRKPGPEELLDFPDNAAVQEHLVAEFVPAVYDRPKAESGPNMPPVARAPRSWNAENAQRWLGYLAKTGTQDIEWWQIGSTIKLRRRMLIVAVAVGLATVLVTVPIYGIEFSIEAGLVPGLERALFSAVVGGLGVGLTFGLMHGFATAKLKDRGPVFEPSHMRPRFDDGFFETWRRLRQRFWRHFLPRVGTGFLGGLLFGGLWASAEALVELFEGYPWLRSLLDTAGLLILGIGVGVGVGLVATVGAALETVIKPEEREETVEPVDLLNASRETVLIQLLAVVLVIGVGFGLEFGFVLGIAAGIGSGLVAGIVVGLGVCTMTAWGRWVLLARIWLPLTGRAPGALFDFLQDAYERGVLRQSGAVYQFRHERIRARLAEGQRPAADSKTEVYQ